MSPVDHHHSNSDTQREALAPEAGRDIHRPRGGIKGPLLGLLFLAILLLIGVLATAF